MIHFAKALHQKAKYFETHFLLSADLAEKLGCVCSTCKVLTSFGLESVTMIGYFEAPSGDIFVKLCGEILDYFLVTFMFAQLFSVFGFFLACFWPIYIRLRSVFVLISLPFRPMYYARRGHFLVWFLGQCANYKNIQSSRKLRITYWFFLQVDPRCHIQYLYWYHETPQGERRLLKTGRNATEPYVHTILSADDRHQGRYYCIINNVMGQNECSAFLIIRNSSPKITTSFSVLNLLLIIVWCYWVWLATVVRRMFYQFLDSF